MSATATAWAWRHSPYSGAQFALHLAAADVANDTHGYLLWTNPITLAAKARTTRETASRWLWRAVEEGLLEAVSDRRGERDGRGYRRASEFRFLMPAIPEKWSPQSRDDKSQGALDPVTTDHEACDDRSQVTQAGVTQATPPVSPKRVRRQTQVPEDFAPDESALAWQRENCPLVSPRVETPKFVDYHLAKGSTFKDWQRAWRNWMRNARPSSPSSPSRPMPSGPVYIDGRGNRVAMTPRGVW